MSYRRYKKTSMFNPSIPLDHYPTYNQRKGMIIQRNMTPPSPRKVISKKDVDDAEELLKKMNLYPKVLEERVYQLAVGIDADTRGSFDINYDSISTGFTQQLGIDMSKIQNIDVMSFIVTSASNSSYFPQVSYTYHYGSFNTTLATSDTSLTTPMTVGVFDCPFIQERDPDVFLRMPYLCRNSNQQTSGFINQSVYALTSPSDIYSAYQSGLKFFPWFNYQQGQPHDVVYTQLTIDNRSFSDAKTLLINGTYSFYE